MKLVKRKNLSKRNQSLIILYALLIALVIISLILLILGKSPLSVYQAMIVGALGNPYRIKETLFEMSLLVIASLGVALALKMRFTNIGGEGQIMIGAVFATFCALNLSHLPVYLLIPLMVIASFLGGGLWGSIATYLKVKLNINESITTLMLNYIAIQIVIILQQGIWRDPASLGYPKIANFSVNALLPNFFGISLGSILMILIVVFVHYLMERFKLGYELSVLGESSQTARYAGMNVNRIIWITMLLSGGLLGLVGMILASGRLGTLTADLSAGIGFTAVMIAWIAKLKPTRIVIIALVFAIIQQGANYMEPVFNIPSSISLVIQATILFCILASDLFMKYRIQFQDEMRSIA